jgi:hypothetical protein
VRNGGYSTASNILNFSNIIQHFSLGRRAINLEIAIAGYEAISKVFTREAFPADWARTQINLGNAYYNRINGERVENLELAIALTLTAVAQSSASRNSTVVNTEALNSDVVP